MNIENINNGRNTNKDSKEQSELRLYRKGPTTDFKQTLDNTMNLNIS